MTFGDEDRRAPAEPFVPMINVVFLLLIFFLMTAQITPPPPFETEPPTASRGADPQSEAVLHISVEGQFAFADAHGDPAIAEARAAAGDAPRTETPVAMAPTSVSGAPSPLPAARRTSAVGCSRSTSSGR